MSSRRLSLNKKKELTEIAKLLCRELRHKSTRAEKLIWEKLRNRNLYDKKFLRQHPLYYDYDGKESFFISDFYCHEEKLIVELDGLYHEYRLNDDKERTDILNVLGIKVIRFKNIEVENNIEEVLEKIKKEFNTLY